MIIVSNRSNIESQSQAKAAVEMDKHSSRKPLLNTAHDKRFDAFNHNSTVLSQNKRVKSFVNLKKALDRNTSFETKNILQVDYAVDDS